MDGGREGGEGGGGGGGLEVWACGRYVNAYHAKVQGIAKKRLDRIIRIQDYKLMEHLKKRRSEHGIQSVSDYARATAGRLVIDVSNHGATRFGAEMVNLLISRSAATDSTAAEFFRSADVVQFDCRQYVTACCSQAAHGTRVRISERIFAGKKVVDPSLSNYAGQLYGFRRAHRAVWCLPPYQFAIYWTFARATVPASLAEDDAGSTHCKLTASGRALFEDATVEAASELRAGVHYVVRGPFGICRGRPWISLSEGAPSELQHGVVIVRHPRPMVPWLNHAFGRGTTKDERCRNKLIYFRPWTAVASDATEQVPHTEDLRAGAGTWADKWRSYIDGGVPCEDVRRYIHGFYNYFETASCAGDVTEEAGTLGDACMSSSGIYNCECAEFAEGRQGGGGVIQQRSHVHVRPVEDHVCITHTGGATGMETCVRGEGGVGAGRVRMDRGLNLARRLAWLTMCIG
jgi:hypothetical protein